MRDEHDCVPCNAECTEKVIVFAHTPVLPAVANDLDSIAWDYAAVLALEVKLVAVSSADVRVARNSRWTE